MRYAPISPDAKNVSCYNVVSLSLLTASQLANSSHPYIRVGSKCVFANSIRILVGVNTVTPRDFEASQKFIHNSF